MNTCVQGIKLGVAQRLVEALAIKMKENYSLAEFEEDLKFLKRAISKGLPLTSLGTKNGLHLSVVNTGSYKRNPNFIFTQGKDIIGVLSLERTRGEGTEIADYEVQTVYLKENFRGKDLGPVLYLAAIHVYKSICSSENIGIAAAKTWKKISQY